MFEVCENAQTESLKANYVEVFLIENKMLVEITPNMPKSQIYVLIAFSAKIALAITKIILSI
ncbi:MAG: hypothetical protein C3F06_04765 [Candidatus Methanoperedenaceae archaeon]|nr:MAG: hypothetical protein C3F06_04765 [Candidatus Methanoperedenaceae archaeon]